MKCPKCGYPRLRYRSSRKKRWKGRAGDSARSERADEPRTDFHVEKCPICGFKGEVK